MEECTHEGRWDFERNQSHERGGRAVLGLLSSPLATLQYLTGSFVDTRYRQCPGSTLAFPFTYVFSLNDLTGSRAHCHC